MRKTSSKVGLDWGHVGLLGLFVLGTLVFLYDTLSESFRLENVIVILPVSALVIVLCVVQMVRQVLRRRAQPLVAKDIDTDQQGSADANPKRWIELVKVPAFMSLLGLYILGLIYVAFDLSTFLFLFLALWLQGEKRLVFGAIYAAVLALALTWGLTYMVPFPFPTVFF